MKARQARSALGFAALLLGGAIGAACGAPAEGSSESFEGHTIERFETAEALLAYGDKGVVPVQVKFVLPRFDEESPGQTHLLDPHFYHLHDEWYWFRLLNGQAIEGVDVPPIEEETFDSIEAIYTRFAQVPKAELPLDLKWIADGTRLYSPRFYELGLWDEPRKLGLGSILHYPAHPERVIPEDLWLFELEYSDASSSAPLTPEMVQRFFTRLEAAMPEPLRPKLRWLLRSQEQRAVADAMAASGDPLGSRVLTYADLVVAGEVQVYNPGISAGYIRRYEAGSLATAELRSNHVVLLEEVPDYLPPVAAILTAVPQTPLAHLNLLAASRGTPNAHVAGLMEIEGPEDWQTWRTPTVVRADERGVTLQPLTKADYETYLELQGAGSYAIPIADLEGAPDFVDLREGSLGGLSDLVPLTGGKAAGMMALFSDGDIPTPHAPMAVTVRPFVEHLEPLDAWIRAVLEDPDFEEDGRVRFLALEGTEDYLKENTREGEDQAWVTDWMQSEASAPLRDLVTAGGLKRVIRDQPLDPDFRAALEAFIEGQFAALDPVQGLRFRSSSTAEDAPGFNGAGLYDSNTGYRDPSLQSADLSKRTLEWALLKTWASYWGFEAFEERRLAGIDHHAGRMAVLVHPRFDDPLELANGVIAFQLAEEDDGNVRTMVVNTQQGAISVTNPDPEAPALPEIVQVSVFGSGAPQIEHVQSSSEVSPGEQVLSDGALLLLFQWVDQLAHDWLAMQNEELPADQARSTVQLDLEFKEMASGWPAGLESAEITQDAAGLVIKQVRTLDRAVRGPQELTSLPIPRDILEQAHVIHERVCLSAELEVRVLEVTTDPAITWCLPFDDVPFDAQITLTFPEGLAEVDFEVNQAVTFTHLEGAFTHSSPEASAQWDLLFITSETTRGETSIQELRVEPSGSWTLTLLDGGERSGTLSCELESLLVSPEAYLETLIHDETPEG